MRERWCVQSSRRSSRARTVSPIVADVRTPSKAGVVAATGDDAGLGPGLSNGAIMMHGCSIEKKEGAETLFAPAASGARPECHRASPDPKGRGGMEERQVATAQRGVACEHLQAVRREGWHARRVATRATAELVLAGDPLPAAPLTNDGVDDQKRERLLRRTLLRGRFSIRLSLA